MSPWRMMNEWGVPGVEHVYSVSRPGLAMITVRFKVNESNEDSLVKVYDNGRFLGTVVAGESKTGRAYSAAFALISRHQFS